MAGEDQDGPAPQGSLYASAAAVAPSRRSLRRRQAIVALAGAAAILAGGAFLGTQLIDGRQPTLPQPAALAPQPPPSPSAPPTEEPPPQLGAKPTLGAARAKLSPVPSPTLDEELLAGASLAALDRQVTERTETTRDGSIRITTARYDLTGQGRLALVADQGTMAGSAHCTNRVRPAAGATATERPNLLLCWRTSPTRSVVTLAVNRSGRPAASGSVAVIEREWAALD
ncbi:hypothetical protein BJY16_009184 [Actinoplanes octamycinicus]|uniref:Uncharacterized protein n=1 Tax=Actinoplanes octamycinicus TaxID=135948 RepID=A0A7W7MDG1_9ACTN|nr:hypothetical protein [Actinoplanes octamycinicus]MBB4745725.1 hypothetical protein [Actinoplanes octamycinicus]GIE56572.1 hypothetical protein Aoc01nite_19740 [Actinoplanes octamycinicus]